jgi:hypothetical protein
MNKKFCPNEEKIRSFAGKNLPQDLADHAAACPVCREALAVAAWMKEFEELTMTSEVAARKLPDPQELWDRAGAGRRVEIEIAHKVLRPISIFKKIAWAVSALGLIILFLTQFQKVTNLLTLISGLGVVKVSLSEAAGGSEVLGILFIITTALCLLGFTIQVLVTGKERIKFK